MGTRGAMGFYVNGEDKITYNHWDSYPSGLGSDIVKDLRMIFAEAGWEIGAEWMKAKVSKIRLVNNDTPASLEDQNKFKQYADTNVSTKDLSEWYVLLRKIQGNIFAQLNAGIMIDNHEFMQDSLFCEWAYIINCDENKLEVYKGFQDNPHNKGRYATLSILKQGEGENTYYPVALVKEVTFETIAKGDDKWIDELENSEEE